MFVSGSLKLIRTSSRGLRGGAGVVHYALLRGVWVWTSLFQTKPWSGLETSTNPHPLTYRTWRGLVSHSQPGSASLLCTSACWLTLRNTVTASSKDLECKERKRSWKHNGFDPLEQPLRLGSIGGQSCNSCKSWCGHLGRIRQPSNQPTNPMSKTIGDLSRRRKISYFSNWTYKEKKDFPLITWKEKVLLNCWIIKCYTF